MATEILVQLCFQSPCLGSIRRVDPEPNRMLRDSAGRVIFKQSWWTAMLSRSAKVYGKHQKDIEEVLFTPEIEGKIDRVKRYYKKRKDTGLVSRFKWHEAFDKGTVITVRAVIPSQLSLKAFKEILDLGGRYYGISPFGWNKGDWGKFNVVTVEQCRNGS